MNRNLIWAVCLATCSHAAMAYDPLTHEEMTDFAVGKSQLKQGDGSLLKNLGLRSLNAKGQEFPNGAGKSLTIIKLFRFGANEEDSPFFPPIRSKHHFYDPVHDRPLTIAEVIGAEKSPDWALANVGQFSSQQYSYANAREYFFRALTKASQTERDKNWGLLFQSLGQVIHHIQDMAQPEHTRNDPHLAPSVFGFTIPIDPSYCEAHT